MSQQITLRVLFFFAACLLLQGELFSQQTAQQSAVKRLAELGAVFSTDSDEKIIGLQFPEGSSFDPQDWHHLEQLSDLRDLDLGALYVGNEILKHVGKLSELRSLNLFGNPLDSIALVDIENLQKLETLYLYRTFIDDKGITSIEKLKRLQRLNMFDTFLTDKGLASLGECKQLQHLSIGNSKAGKFPESFFTEAGIEKLRQDLQQTKITYWGSDDRLEVAKTIQKPTGKLLRETQLLNTKAEPAPNLATNNAGSDWPCFLGPSRDGKSSDVGIHTNWIRRPPKLQWQKKVGTGYAAPTISKGRLLLYHRVPNANGNSRFSERLTCFNSETGKSLWNVDFPTDYEDLNGYGDGPRSTPLVDNDRIYLFSPSGVLRCLQLLDGKTLWELDLLQKFDGELPTYGMGSSPVIYRDMVLVVVGGSSGRKDQHTVVALDKTNGVFRYGSGEHPAGYATPVFTTEFGRPWCFLFHQDGLSVFNPDNGEHDDFVEWKARIAGCANAACPVVNGSQVFVSESYKHGGAMFRFGGRNLETVWQDSAKVREKSMACHWNTPIVHQGFLFGCSGRHRSNGELKCIEWATGQTRWKIKLDGRSALTYIDGHFLNQSESGLLTLFQASPSGYVEAGRLDKTNGAVVPSYPAWTAPVVAKGLMYLRGKHELICYDLNPE